MNLPWILTIGWLLISGLVGFTLMGVDKSKARSGSRRIPERFLYELAAVGGVFGIVLGSGVFHHKSKKDSFLAVVFLVGVVWIAVLIELERLLGPPTA